MSIEEFKPEITTPESQSTDRNPVGIEGNDAFDAEGKPRSRRVMPNMDVEYLSDQEYADAITTYHENNK